ncbi:MAG: LicD family protein, partial [Clostridia bacterium]|nr:LicD family protein [Clostridia bacterium]
MTLEELHNKLYDLLCIVDDICKKEGVRWFIDGGTEIGAVREKNFVPWDDDLDIKVLREDYEAFKAAMIKHLPSNYRFIEPEEFSPYFYDFVP